MNFKFEIGSHLALKAMTELEPEMGNIPILVVVIRRFEDWTTGMSLLYYCRVIHSGEFGPRQDFRGTPTTVSNLYLFHEEELVLYKKKEATEATEEERIAKHGLTGS